VAAAFGIARVAEAPQRLDVLSAAVPAPRHLPVFASAGIARPDRFFDQLVRDGWTVAGTRAWRDHHRYDARDVASLISAATAAGAAAVVTTEKDLMRLLPFRPLALPIIWVPLSVRIEPADDFADWLMAKLADARPTSATRAVAGSAAESGR
jgi:tetraacyldisaccharide-1-P 4'-kinase